MTNHLSPASDDDDLISLIDISDTEATIKSPVTPIRGFHTANWKTWTALVPDIPSARPSPSKTANNIPLPTTRSEHDQGGLEVNLSPEAEPFHSPYYPITSPLYTSPLKFGVDDSWGDGGLSAGRPIKPYRYEGGALVAAVDGINRDVVLPPKSKPISIRSPTPKQASTIEASSSGVRAQASVEDKAFVHAGEVTMESTALAPVSPYRSGDDKEGQGDQIAHDVYPAHAAPSLESHAPKQDDVVPYSMPAGKQDDIALSPMDQLVDSLHSFSLANSNGTSGLDAIHPGETSVPDLGSDAPGGVSLSPPKKPLEGTMLENSSKSELPGPIDPLETQLHLPPYDRKEIEVTQDGASNPVSWAATATNDVHNASQTAQGANLAEDEASDQVNGRPDTAYIHRPHTSVTPPSPRARASPVPSNVYDAALGDSSGDLTARYSVPDITLATPRTPSAKG